MAPTRRSILRASTAATTGLLGGLAGCIGGDGETPTGMASPTASPMPTGTVSPTDAMDAVALSVTDQETDSRTVTVAQAVIDEEGWLVVHPEADGGGPNGAVTLATMQLSPGEYTDIELELDRMLDGSQTVYGMLHYDDPTDGSFTFPGNGDPPVTKDGSPIVKPFEVTYTGMATPALSVADQETDGTVVTVPSFAIDAPGWFVIHPEADGGGPNGGVTLATMPLHPGLYADVRIELDEPLAADQTIYGMLHYDDPEDGEFTFPESGDPAVMKDGSPVLKPFDVTVTGGMGGTSTPTAGPSVTVDMVNTTFDPKRVSVEPGATVEWVNRDPYGHDVTAAQFHDVAASWDFSRTLDDGESTTYTFADAGIYEYYCTIHGQGTMCGAVLVGDVSLDQDLPCEGDDGGFYGISI